MRHEPTLRIPLGILALLAALIIYGVVMVQFVSPLMATWPILLRAGAYLVLGTIWLIPLRRFMIWMETGRFS